MLQMDLLEEIGAGGDFTSSSKAMMRTIKLFSKEIYIPKILNTKDRSTWEAEGGKDAFAKAKEYVDEVLAKYEPELPPADIISELNRVMDRAAKRYGSSLEKLPWSCKP